MTCGLCQSSEHADHEYTQIIVLVALLRQHFQRKQEKHTHRGLLPPKPTTAKAPSRVNSSAETRLTVPALARAKMAITSSFENLRSKPPTEKKQKSKTENQQSSDVYRSSSPLFARKTSINTLMAPVSTSPLREGGGRSRSWTAGVGEICRPAPVSLESNNQGDKDQGKIQGDSDESEKQNGGDDKGVSETPMFTTPKKKDLQHRHSLTPPSSSAEEFLFKGHRRSTSTITFGSWRQEIYDSVCTPTKLEKDFNRADSDICE